MESAVNVRTTLSGGHSSRPERVWASLYIVDDLCQSVFSSLARSDQRRWARNYVHGLLTTSGRKSMRRIAAQLGPGTEHRLQQFISKSPWDWKPVRRALADQVAASTGPIAWALEPLFIPKAGEHSVGVERQFVPQLGRVSNCQQAYGVWMIGEQSAYPVEWGLALPDSWTVDSRQRKRVGIPEHMESRPALDCGLDALQGIADQRRPVLMDVADADLPRVLGVLETGRIPFLLRVGGTFPVCAAEPGSALTGQWVSARRLVNSLNGHTSPVEWLDRARPSRRVTLVASATVYVQGSRRPLRLLGAWTDPTSPWAADLWLSDRPQQPPAQMFRTAQLGRLVQRDMREVSVPIGVSDFEGRSFRGWHHHTTLVSVAHAASLLTEAREEEYARLRPPVQQALPSRAEPVPAPRRAGPDRVLRMPTI